MDDGLARVRTAYSSDPEREWRRLEGGAQARLEYLVTTQALERHLPRPDAHPDRTLRVLDAGGGPGRYTLDLARRGYAVTLLDLSPALLDLARCRIADAEPPVQTRVEDLVEGSITDLSRFGDGEFDAVLCLGGVLSHVVAPLQRKQALCDLSRVAKPDAPVFVSAMNRLGVYRSAVQWPQVFPRVFPHIAETGMDTLGLGAPCYLFLPEEFVTALTAAMLELERLYGCSGIGAHLQEDNLLALMADPERWATWRQVLLATCDHPNVVGVSNHLLAVTRRTRSAQCGV